MSKKIFVSTFLILFISISCLPGQTFKATMAKRPDLVAYQLWIWPNKPTSREWFDIRTRVYNMSNHPLQQNAVIHLFVGGSKDPYVINVAPLGAKKERMYTRKIFLDVPGKYRARVVVDPGNKIRESRENNNTKQITFRVRKAENQDYLPDLSVGAPYFEPKKPCIDDQIKFRISVHNHGAVAAPPSKAAIKIGGGLPVSLNIPAIDPEEFKSVSYTHLLPVARKYVVTVYADYGNKITEYNEGNNKKSKNFEVFDQCCPDLVAYQLWIWPKNPKAGEKFDIRCRIYNKGLKPTLTPTEVNIYVGGATTPYVLNIGQYSYLDAKMFTQEISLNRAGKYVARIVVDPNRKIKECRKDNNERKIEFRVR